MVRKYKAKKRISNRLLYTLIAVGILAILGVAVYAVAPNPGHDASQLDLSGGVNGNAVFNGNVSAAGSVSANSIGANFISGDGSGLNNLKIKITPSNSVCTSVNEGLVRYYGGICARDDFKSSTYDMCMRTASNTYGWVNIKYFEWQDVSCNLNGCPSGQDYYQCSNPSVPSGCYSSEPAGCWCQGTEIVCPF
ncbi:MAG: hypothetical protein Q8P79_01500 [Nanoarchaeota archaeon]|nr:hypothetical protein [Nanoarchaeota archaeon]